MLTTTTEQSPVIVDHPRAQRFIEDWLKRWRREHANESAKYRVRFEEKISRCSVFVDWGFMGQKNNHVVVQYDLSRPETEALLHNTMTGVVEPKEAWKQRETRWKGAV